MHPHSTTVSLHESGELPSLPRVPLRLFVFIIARKGYSTRKTSRSRDFFHSPPPPPLRPCEQPWPLCVLPQPMKHLMLILTEKRATKLHFTLTLQTRFPFARGHTGRSCHDCKQFCLEQHGMLQQCIRSVQAVTCSPAMPAPEICRAGDKKVIKK